MSFDGDEKRWICSRGPLVILQRVSSMVKEISMDPCLNQSPSKRSKPLKPKKWKSFFDDNGKISGFRTALKLIILGGIEPSIRAEVWEFLLGCYSSNSTAEYRKQLRIARRERYNDLIKECQTMDPSVGTGNLAYAIGSKVMDARTFLKDNDMGENEMAANHAKKGSYSYVEKNDTDTHLKHTVSHSDSATCDPSCDSPFADACNCFSDSGMEVDESSFSSEHFLDFPPLPVTNLFQKDSPEEKCCQVHRRQSFSEHTPNDLLSTSQSKSGAFFSADTSHNSNSQMETFDSSTEGRIQGQKKRDFKNDVNRLRTSDVLPEEVIMSTSISNGLNSSINRASEWRWTLHRIVVDVVRTDVHLEFYEDSRNIARMSDILAVYAWIDPGTGYCQGMSDLLSPFVVLYKDNADAFWCFEMLLRRLRENFQMEGPLGIFKQLETLWKILEHTDTEVYTHLSLIGAENLFFAFRMLLVLFRRELSFDEVFSMWEMMWAVDFSEALTQRLERNCLEPLLLQQLKDSDTENSEMGTKHVSSKQNNDEFVTCEDNGVKHHYSRPFCGLSKANFWVKHNQMQLSTLSTSSRNIDDGLPVFIVAAILITNRQNIMRNTHSVDDIIKMFNDNLLNINVKRCIRLAIKLQNKYFSKWSRKQRTF